ncbi:nuclear transport factor 2 family protein [Cryobacterium arcticum]|uniref:DUF4440 domain-containing protein n=1 Tax=Cryobacterium arcticum TaxID=670052 RepID=A0A1B1BKN4_9MICO|nr:nuclear transport factor 2 family protein [Cryobacterium arcticum]ANP73170.1 hypothetical protein PA27867_2218 [Cryobacterium arcticum]
MPSTPHTPLDVVEEITRDFLAQREAMVDADVSRLGSLLTEDFTLTHMTGYQQSRAEWLDDIATGQMTYHSIRNVDITPVVTAASVTLTARCHTHATIWGTEGTWPLQLRIDFVRTSVGWAAKRTVASTW